MKSKTTQQITTAPRRRSSAIGSADMSITINFGDYRICCADHCTLEEMERRIPEAFDRLKRGIASGIEGAITHE